MAVIEHLDIIEYRPSGSPVWLNTPDPQTRHLLEYGKTFYHGIIIAVPLSTHTGDHAEGL